MLSSRGVSKFYEDLVILSKFSQELVFYRYITKICFFLNFTKIWYCTKFFSNSFNNFRTSSIKKFYWSQLIVRKAKPLCYILQSSIKTSVTDIPSIKTGQIEQTVFNYLQISVVLVSLFPLRNLRMSGGSLQPLIPEDNEHNCGDQDQYHHRQYADNEADILFGFFLPVACLC